MRAVDGAGQAHVRGCGIQPAEGHRRREVHLSSATFAVGGHDWRLLFYPAGYSLEHGQDYASAFLQLVSKADEVRVIFEFGLVNLETMHSKVVAGVKEPWVFSSTAPNWGFTKVMKRSELEGLPFLRDNRLMLECNVTVLMGTLVSESKTICGIQVPPSDLVDNLVKLLESGEGADVTFKIEEEVFHAHKIVLAMRSPVFKVELYGPMRDKMEPMITVEDMQPAVFKALLHFIYTDSLPGSMENPDKDENEEMIKLLLVAADRYAMERMKLMCENILSKRLDVGSVATTLALADQHHCSKLKDACIQFINSSASMDDLVASQGYEHLKRACPTIFVNIWERSTKYRSM